MSNPFDDGFVPEDHDENEDAEEFEPDVATVAFLDQQQAEFGNMEAEFEDTYGFKHECHCGEDYAAGRVGEITQCYHNMMQEALATCARLQAEVKEITGIAQALYTELRSRIEAEEGTGSVPEQPKLTVVEGEGLDSESEADTSEDAGDSAAADSAGEGLGISGDVVGEATDSDPEPGKSDDRKLI